MAQISRYGNKKDEMFLKSVELMALKYGVEKYAVLTANAATIKNDSLVYYQVDERCDILKAVFNA